MSNPKSEILAAPKQSGGGRNPKEARNPKSEGPESHTRRCCFGLRTSAFFRISDFGLRVSRSRAAFTLIEIMVVVIIIGILAGIITLQFRGTTQDAKVTAARADISTMKTALEQFNLHMDRYPTTEEGLRVLIERPADDDGHKWHGPYIDRARNDPWGNPYQYALPSSHQNTTFDLWSKGPPASADGQNAEIGNWQ